MRILVLALGVWCVIGLVAGADDFADKAAHNWHQWRGPQANGVALFGDPPIKFDEETNVKWKISIPGDSTATPIIWGDKVFTLTAIDTEVAAEGAPAARGGGGARGGARGGLGALGGMMGGGGKPKNVYKFELLCLDRNTGKTIWEKVAREEVPHEGKHADGSFAASSPMTDGKNIYVSFGSRGIYCYDLDGNQKWTRDLGKMTILNTFGEAISPVVHGDTVIVNWDHQNGSFLYALDAATGDIRWKQERDEKTTWATPLVVDYNGRTQVITNGIKRVRSYDLKTGDLVWECGGQTSAAIPSPVANDKLAFVMTGFMGYALFAIPLDSTGDLTGTDKIAWKRSAGTPYVPSPLLFGDLLYTTQGNSNVMSCLDAKTGEPLIDRKRLSGVTNLYASPLGVGDRVYFAGREGGVTVIKKGPELEVLATNKLSDRFDASPAVVGKQLFLRGANIYTASKPRRLPARHSSIPSVYLSIIEFDPKG